jgi:hypothetical protein
VPEGCHPCDDELPELVPEPFVDELPDELAVPDVPVDAACAVP